MIPYDPIIGPRKYDFLLLSVFGLSVATLYSNTHYDAVNRKYVVVTIGNNDTLSLPIATQIS
jgi:hypothetical protein